MLKIVRICVAVSLVVGMAGCAALLGPPARKPSEAPMPPASFSFIGQGNDQPPTSEPASYIASAKELPPGFHHNPQADVGRMATTAPVVSPHYPTAADPDAVLGRIQFRYPNGRRTALEHSDRAELLRFAAQHGANAVYDAGQITVQGIDREVYWALHVSKAMPPPAPKAAAVLARLLPHRARVLAKHKVELEDTELPRFEKFHVRRGKCYSVALVLDSGTTRTRSRGWLASWHQQNGFPRGSARLFGPAFDGTAHRGRLAKLYCPLLDGEQQVTITRSSKSSDGTGAAVLALVETPQPPGGLAKEACEMCAPVQFDCHNMTLRACAPSMRCLRGVRISPSQCRR